MAESLKRQAPAKQNDAITDPVPDQEPGEAKVEAEAEAQPAIHGPDQRSDAPRTNHDDHPFTNFREGEKIAIIITASFLALASPIATSTYLPAINTLAEDLHVSVTLMNLTITTYMIFQGLAPSFAGTFSDTKGRRPAYLCCLTVYLVANVGLATQDNYAALAVLRCVQSSGSSGTIAIASAVVADVSTRAERGKYIGYATMGVTLGPAIGPILGGVIAQELGWRWIFWVLAIFAGAMLLVVIFLFPETCRCVCGDGSVPPPRWNRTVYQIWHQARRPDLYRQGRWNGHVVRRESIMQPRFRARPWNVLKIAVQKEAGIILLYGAVVYSGYMMVVSTLTSQLHARYGLSTLQIGLCYLPIGLGSLTSRWTMGILLDRNFKRQAARQGLAIVANRQQNIDAFDIEQARLQITLPFLALATASTVAYGWVMQYRTALAAPLVLLFFLGHFTTGTFSSLNTLIVDTNRESPATATASSNLFRCLMGAGATAFGNPLIRRIGIGWTSMVVTGVWIVAFPALLLLFTRGMRWRTEARREAERKRAEEEQKKKPRNRVPVAFCWPTCLKAR